MSNLPGGVGVGGGGEGLSQGTEGAGGGDWGGHCWGMVWEVVVVMEGLNMEVAHSISWRDTFLTGVTGGSR